MYVVGRRMVLFHTRQTFIMVTAVNNKVCNMPCTLYYMACFDSVF